MKGDGNGLERLDQTRRKRAAEGEANCDAAEALMSIVPVTMYGVIALLDYLHGFERLLPPDDWHDGLPDGFEAAVRENVRKALKAMV
jgi:hypothetical protein